MTETRLATPPAHLVRRPESRLSTPDSSRLGTPPIGRSRTMVRHERKTSLQSNIDQFKLFQALRLRPETQKHVSLSARASNLASGDGPAAALDRNSTICRAVLVLWSQRETLHAVRKWRDVTQHENRRLRDAYVRNLRSSTRELLELRAKIPFALAPAQLETLVQWATQIQIKTFEGVPHRVVEDTVQHMRFRTYKDNECLFMEGDVGHFYYILFTGSIGIYVGMSADSKAAVAASRVQALKTIRVDPTFLGHFIYAIPEGDGFGEVAMFMAEARRTASAVAVGVCDLIEIPKDVSVLPDHSFETGSVSKAQKMAFLPSVDLFADWIQAKIAAVSDLVEQHQLSFGHRLLTADRAINNVIFVVSGDVIVTQQWLEDVPDQPPHAPGYKHTPKKAMDIQVERVTRRGILGLPLLLSDDAKASHDATVATASATVLVIKPDQLTALRALMPANGPTQLAKKWYVQQQQRDERFRQAVAALRHAHDPPPDALPPPVAPPTNQDSDRAALPVLPIMVSLSGRKFLCQDWDMLVDRADVKVKYSPATVPRQLAEDSTEQRKIAAQYFTELDAKPCVYHWDPQGGGFTGQRRASDTDMYVDKTKAERKANEARGPTRTHKDELESHIYRTRRLARAVVGEHQAFLKTRAVVVRRETSYKHSF
ncbi:Aste57867_1819 [Aphanomyces stellatus]|uniref:Aste57867_1819 protein n=1 Tax=Aphanomyces stellatus TaxID=120398 RepID=A0A485K7C0_9STRA|nr:hypothetical protein As57867_001817 [Aphanomyces stellatus]VFT79028.1 Aste57867_1819 [Aphanomyces stellatus]